MTVKELMEILKGFKPEDEIFIGAEGYIDSDIRVGQRVDGKILICDYCYYGEIDSK
jgi:hypothetical protein